jgi:hypothetical protein
MGYREPIATIVEICVTLVFDQTSIASSGKPVFLPSTPDPRRPSPVVQEPGRFEADDFYMCR